METTTDGSGRFARNVMHFARTLRAAGLPVGPGRVLEALRAVERGGLREPATISTGRCTRCS